MLQIDMSPTPPFTAKAALKAYSPMFHFRKCYRRYLAKRTKILPKIILNTETREDTDLTKTKKTEYQITLFTFC